MTHGEQFSGALGRLEQQRALLLGEAQSLSQIQLDFRPSRSAWSVGEVIHHVGLAEKVWQNYIAKVLEKGGPHQGALLRVSFKEVLFKSALIPDAVLRSPFFLAPVSLMTSVIPTPLQSFMVSVPLVRMQAGPRMQPKHGLSRASLFGFAGQVREATLNTLADKGGWNLSLFRIRHPLLGNRDIYAILELLASHDQRHRLQIESIKRNPDFPG